ncbi:cytochrome P460 family protein [Methylomagnum sp.]
MKKNAWLIALLLAFTSLSQADETQKMSGAISLSENYKNFRLISLSQRSDNHTLRAILGNDIALEAVRTGKTNPWPNGSILAKLSWQHKSNPVFPAATVPDEFVSAAFMAKDTEKYAATGGWGWGEWTGLEQKAYDKPSFAQECVACHTAVKDQDLVFTRPVKLP